MGAANLDGILQAVTRIGNVKVGGVSTGTIRVLNAIGGTNISSLTAVGGIGADNLEIFGSIGKITVGRDTEADAKPAGT